ncbi:hypothetical protein GQ457_11G011300 [Hibiscus cannabinus]
MEKLSYINLPKTFYPQIQNILVSANSDLKVSVCVLRKCNLKRQVSVGKNRAERVWCSAVEDEACELVNGVELSIGEGDDNIQAYLFKAVKNNNRAGVLLLSYVFDFKIQPQEILHTDLPAMVTMSLFQTYFAVILGQRAGRKQWLANQDPRRVANDIATSTKWMVDEFVAAGFSKKLGIIGFCFGGGQVMDVLAADLGETDDPLCRVSVLSEFEKFVGKVSRVVIFKGRGHAFAHRPGSVEEDEDAEQAFTLMRNWLHGGLNFQNSLFNLCED